MALHHALTRVVGSAGECCDADVDRVALLDQDQILLCTDGLTNMLKASEIAAVLQDAPTAADACQRLLAAALKNGGKDNVSVALARFRFLSGN